MELENENIKIVMIEPGAIKTPLWEKASEKSHKLEDSDLYRPASRYLRNFIINHNRRGITSLQVARTVYKVLTVRTPRFDYLVGMEAHLLNAVVSFLPKSIYQTYIKRSIWRPHLPR